MRRLVLAAGPEPPSARRGVPANCVLLASDASFLNITTLSGVFDAGAGWSEWGGRKGGWMQVQEAYRAVCLGYDMRNFCIIYTVCTYVLLLR